MGMLYEVMKSIRNYFPDTSNALTGEFTVSDGALALPSVKDGQHVLIRGSVFNDGVFQAPLVGLTDETFNGDVVPLRVPPDFLALVGEIEKWQTANGDAVTSPYQSESFGGYSYTKANSSAPNGGSLSWMDAFASRLNVWRKI